MKKSLFCSSLQGDSSVAVLVCSHVCGFMSGVCFGIVWSFFYPSFDAPGRLRFVVVVLPGYLL